MKELIAAVVPPVAERMLTTLFPGLATHKLGVVVLTQVIAIAVQVAWSKGTARHGHHKHLSN